MATLFAIYIGAYLISLFFICAMGAAMAMFGQGPFAKMGEWGQSVSWTMLFFLAVLFGIFGFATFAVYVGG